MNRRALVLAAALCAGALLTCAGPGTTPDSGLDAPPAGLSPNAAPRGAPAAPAPPKAARDDDREPGLPRPNRGRMLDAVAQDTKCQQCHLHEAAEQRASLHRRSAVDPAYRAAFAIEPSPFCEGCHAPESVRDRPVPAAVREMGVGCVSCHVTDDGDILAAPRDEAARPRDPEAPPPHRVRPSAAFARTGGCAGCHEFPFPQGRIGGADGDFMQTTVREHARSQASERACADCHMPRVSGRRSHAFGQVRDPAWLRERLHATAERADEGTLRITLAQSDPGHAFPTGDLFRRLAVGSEVRGPRGELLARDVRYPRRHLDVVPGAPGRVLTADDRVLDAPLEIELDLSAAEDRTSGHAKVRWWVTLQRVATVGTGARPEEAKVESETPIHQGEMVW